MTPSKRQFSNSAWLATLKDGDRVAVARNGAVVAHGTVHYVGGSDIHLGPWGVFRRDNGQEKDPQMGGSRYLVPAPEADHG